MDHLAILTKSGRFLDKILSGEKTIESRWYVTKRTPWNKIKKGDSIYLKNSGEPVTAKATVDEVMQFELDKEKVKDILEKHGKEICITDIQTSYEKNKDKRYCILISLKDAQKVEPFTIDKTGFGLMSAWITVSDIKEIIRNPRNQIL